jgi:hypothetical protein
MQGRLVTTIVLVVGTVLFVVGTVLLLGGLLFQGNLFGAPVAGIAIGVVLCVLASIAKYRIDRG